MSSQRTISVKRSRHLARAASRRHFEELWNEWTIAGHEDDVAIMRTLSLPVAPAPTAPPPPQPTVAGLPPKDEMRARFHALRRTLAEDSTPR